VYAYVENMYPKTTYYPDGGISTTKTTEYGRDGKEIKK
jgi:hypothetical protein